ncbi:PEP/pyruvate-binding domain-containing protein [Streptomyces sp. SAJ15]|uniref:PEP/pyruvate-binding domain-containing protein n=1 Tax=Streptomyces sp. SAJ15 TaxID=2011095 RepID=UPI0021B2C148|nr:PEP/pyruvate-binding domain-containing protein [Streptomyces sp. SAJ15]
MGIETDLLAVVPLDSEHAKDPAVTGAKAANLARAAVAGLPVLPGFALVPAGRAKGAPAGDEELRRAWRELAGEDGRPLVVRSSSAHEDAEDSSMAGRFESVLDVRGWEEFTAAVRTVLDSARRVQVLHPPEGRNADPLDGMAVLVQPMLRSVTGGVMFGADPVAGREDRILVSAVSGGPDRLVDGSTQGVRYQLSRSGRRLRTDPAEPRSARLLGRRETTSLVRLARKTQRVFGRPQDMEFGFDAEGRLWLFQARPITAMAVRPPRGARLLGPGPVAETFPGVLQPLEEDLWVAPMSHGLTLALDLTGAAPRRRLRSLPVVTTVDGRAAADLRLLGVVRSAHPLRDFINPAPGARRVAAAWRVGRLRSALPLLALDLMADVDRRLADFPAPARMLSGQILDAVSWGRAVLSSLHAQESLAGALLVSGSGATAAGEALAVLAEGRAQGLSDARLLARHPVLLSLLPPTLGARAALPEGTAGTGVPHGVGSLPVREGLRLRIRWVQEMQAEMVRELGTRLRVGDDAVGLSRLLLLRWSELTEAADGGGLPPDLAERLPRPDAPALPSAFRLADGRPVAQLAVTRGRTGAGQGAGGGFGTGTAWDGHGDRPEHAVLVVRVLDPALAPLLPGLAGLVAETGSVLSHLAVLAREYQVPTAVGVSDALDRFPPGTELSVDGGTGAVEKAGEHAAPRTSASGKGAAA